MTTISALLAAEHFQDLLREAETERRLGLFRSARPNHRVELFDLLRGLRTGLRRLRDAVTGPSGPRPAAA